MKQLTLSFCLILPLLFTFITVFSQENSSDRFEIETDPFAYLLNGYSFHAAYTKSSFRFSLGTFGLEQPGFALDNKAFSIFTSGFDIKTDFLFGSTKGIFIGAQATYGRDKLSLESRNIEKVLWGATVGLRTGYRFFFGKEAKNYKGFYIVPWMLVGYSPHAKTIELSGETYEQTKWIPFPTIHFGWRF